MKEDFLHYLWKYKMFNISNIISTKKENIQVINSGIHNTNSGPDFFNAQVEIDSQLWAGNVEIHVKSSDWYVHNHEQDAAYDNVILHVVWEDDMPVFRRDNSSITTLILKNYVAKELIGRYNMLFSKKQSWISCEKSIHKIDSFLLNNWKEHLYIERLNQKSVQILSLLEESKNDWEAVLFKMFAKNFGLKVNGDAFMDMACSFDFSLVRKNQHNREQLEALFFGQSGMLFENAHEVYYLDLQKEYKYLMTKYNIKAIEKGKVKFFRLRPNNFPTIRLSQLATIYVSYSNLFSNLMEINTIESFYDLLQVRTSTFWETHYSFTSSSSKRTKRLTKSFVDLLLINTIIPLKFVYQQYIGKTNEEDIIETIIQIKPEKNSIIDKYKTLKIKANNALETQALLQLKKKYCIKQKCLQCAIGNNLLRVPI